LNGSPLTTLFIAFLAGIAATIIFARAAPALRLVDYPGGRKTHAGAVPLVGGLAIFVAFIGVASAIGIVTSASYFVFALSVVIAVGLWDDVAEIRPRVKFAIQITATGLMIFGAGVQLHGVGDLVGWRAIGLGALSIPLTIFAIVGVINSINMMDGLDGLGGSIAFVAFAWYAAVAINSGLHVQFEIALIFCGAISGFLLFNLRFPWQSNARVFLGDAGSLMIGFGLGWFAIDLTQGPGRSFPPIAALWILLLPLADCVSLMTRRLRAGTSPFVADRHHIHHYLLARGFTHGQTLGMLVGLAGGFGAVGYFGWQLGIPEPVLFWSFFISFFGYHFWIQRAWKALGRNRADTSVTVEEPERVPVA
jgi:UDP-GlcNAc:undecaprenyl-phosphate GlcNAc-1-phosphate transferase